MTSNVGQSIFYDAESLKVHFQKYFDLTHVYISQFYCTWCPTKRNSFLNCNISKGIICDAILHDAMFYSN